MAKKYRIHPVQMAGTDGRFHLVFVPQKLVLGLFWKDIPCNRVPGASTGFDTVSEACQFIASQSICGDQRAAGKREVI